MPNDEMIEAGRHWREANPDLARRMLGEPKLHGGGGVGKHGQVFNIPNDRRRREAWERWEQELILNPGDLSLAQQAARLGRSKAAIVTRRCLLLDTAHRHHPAAACSPPVLRHPCWQPDGCEMIAGRCRSCERRVTGGQR